MKITDFAAHITRIEAGKRQIDVAQVSEVLKIVNKELFGIPYLLIRLKGTVLFLAGRTIAVALLVTLMAAGIMEFVRSCAPVPPAPVEVVEPDDDCQGNHPPVAVISVTGAAA